jgi:hypothetical protein
MVDLPQEKSLTQKFLRYFPWFAASWVIYIAYYYVNQKFILQSIWDGGLFKSGPIRFLVREIAVYSIAFVNYLHLRKSLKGTYPMQFWVFLAALDIVCLLLGFFREFAFEITALQAIYNNIIGLIASPIYSVVFFLYANYFSAQENQS